MSRSGVGKTGVLGVKGTYWGAPSAMTSEVMGMDIGENGGNILGVRRGENDGNPGEKGVDSH